jgi:hypothetical protein
MMSQCVKTHIHVMKGLAMNEILFLVEEAHEGGFLARAMGQSIYTEADDVESLHRQIRDAVRCHFDEGKGPKLIRLHFIREEVIAA